LVEQGRASIQKVTISKRGGRWQVAFSVRYYERPRPAPRRRLGDVVGVDAGVKHLATLSVAVPGVSDEHGHVENPEVLATQLPRLARLDRCIARCTKGSRNQERLVARRARLHGRVAKTRALHLHTLSKALSGSFENVVIEDLNVAGMTKSNRTLARRLHDTGLFELRRQLTYKCADRGTKLVVVDRYFASSKTCSRCGVVKATLPLFERVFHCEACGLVTDRDRNAAKNLEQEGRRILLEEMEVVTAGAAVGSKEDKSNTVAGLRPETLNADPRVQKTTRARARAAALA
jgi:putative transposase